MIASVLDGYSAACDRASITDRPTVWATHTNIWGEPRGEIGIDADTVGTIGGPDVATFAALVPFIVVPTIAVSALVIDHSDRRKLTVIHISIDHTETTVSPWRVSYGIKDDGTLSHARPIMASVPSELQRVLDTVIDARCDQFAWTEDLEFDGSLKVAVAFMRMLSE